MKQVITPTPDIACRPGYCLEYVRESYGLPARYGSATEAWEASTTQHRDTAFPEGVWVPLWFSLDATPLGHVVNRAPDGSVWSTSDLGTTPHHHPDLADLMGYYAYYGVPLTYLGWTEDVAGFTVATPDTESDTMTTQFTEQDRAVENSANIRAGMAASEATNAKLAAQHADASITVLAAAVSALTGLISHQQGLDAAAVKQAVQDAINHGLTLTITPTP